LPFQVRVKKLIFYGPVFSFLTELRMPTTLWIRHAPKAWSNGHAQKDTPAHDPPIIPEAKEQIMKTTCELMAIHGIPDRIVVSPFLRTRMTAAMMVSTIRSISRKSPEIVIDSNIEEFLGWQTPHGKPAALHPTTEKLTKPKLGEPKPDFDRRVIHHVTQLRQEWKEKPELNVWVITHRIVISQIYNLLRADDTPCHSEFPDLTGILYKDGVTSLLIPTAAKPKIVDLAKPETVESLAKPESHCGL
jgi:broad specificity phosphatase PhoE